jgi:predicted membrane-bound spermidine synthase
LLGSHSEATAAVLALFLGGLSLGYALFGRVSKQIAERSGGSKGRLLLAYGFVEAAIGVLALVFPWLFSAVQAFSLWLPVTFSGLAFALDVMLSALLIGPPAVLMGGTIPLLTQALARDVEDATRFHALVYGFNTAGALAGALAAGFFVLPALGLAGSVVAMGLLNLGAGLVFVALGLRAAEGGAPVAAGGSTPTVDAPALGSGAYAGFAVTALLAGFAMMALQTTLNRIGGLAMGASHFTFAMVVATFVFCIALGSLAVSLLPRIHPALVVLSQWALVVYLVVLYGVVEDAPYYAHMIRALFTSERASFYPYHFAIFLGLLVVTLVPLALSGALLPLLFHHLRDKVGDLGAVAGRLYSWNTVGSLVGALLGGYALFFWLDLHHIYRVAVVALAAGSTILTALVLPERRRLALVALGLLLVAVVSQPTWDPRKLAVGAFREHEPMPISFLGPEVFFAHFQDRYDGPDYVRFYDDDPSISVAVFDGVTKSGERTRAIVNNGKVDGLVPMDEVTMCLAAILPAMFSQRAERSFVIGYGTGLTVGDLAALDSMREVVVAEISSGVLAAAPLFEELNRGAAASPKTHLVRGDAYRSLLRSEGAYDIIVSEPSNPWVTGVEMLFSEEFLRAARRRLNPGGVYAQWFHTYETDPASVELVLNTYRQVFDRVAIWYGTAFDLILLGFADDDVTLDLDFVEKQFERSDIRMQLRDIGIESFAELLAHEVVPIGVVAEARLNDRVHTIGHPLLSHTAARAFFAGKHSRLPPTLNGEAARLGAQNSLLRRYAARFGGRLPDPIRAQVVTEVCHLDGPRCATLFAQWQYESPESPVLPRLLAHMRRLPAVADQLSPDRLAKLTWLFDAGTLPDVPYDYKSAARGARLFVDHYHHAAPFDGHALAAIWSRCSGDERCRSGADRHRGMGYARSGASDRAANGRGRSSRISVAGRKPG